MPPRPSALHRRTVLGVLVLGTAGCSLEPLEPSPEESPSPAPEGATSPAGATSASTSASPEPEPDADEALVTAVLAALAAAHRTATATVRAHRDLAGAVRPLADLHLVHARELGGPPRPGRGAEEPRLPRAAALARVERVEERLQGTLADAATTAGSGALAQTLAAMAAGTAQLRTTLPTGRP